MMLDNITILFPFGTEFRIGAYRGTQFRFPLDASEIQISHIRSRSATRGVMSMRTNIEIHDDYCKDLNSAEIECVLTQITVLITDAVLRATYQSEDAA